LSTQLAHPQAGVAALQILGSSALNPNMQNDGHLKPLWDEDRVQALSHHTAVDRVICLGSVLAVHLKVPEGSGGFASGAARGVTGRMRGYGVYARPLGNVVYLMVTPTSSRDTTDGLLTALEACL
jgi:bifunctional dethiobiotin synthetase / adenosylmethionine---8-amino-7-oxononanoate aminotransferase